MLETLETEYNGKRAVIRFIFIICTHYIHYFPYRYSKNNMASSEWFKQQYRSLCIYHIMTLPLLQVLELWGVLQWISGIALLMVEVVAPQEERHHEADNRSRQRYKTPTHECHQELCIRRNLEQLLLLYPFLRLSVLRIARLWFHPQIRNLEGNEMCNFLGFSSNNFYINYKARKTLSKYLKLLIMKVLLNIICRFGAYGDFE